MTDVFPLRNLPNEAEEWGRTVEERIYQAENRQATSGQSLSGMGRSSSAILGSLADQVRDIQNLYNSIPIPQQQSTSISGFPVPISNTWNTVTSVTLSPGGTGTLVLNAVASGQLVSSTSGDLSCYFRLVLSTGASSPTVPGMHAFSGGVGGNNFLVNWAWSVSVSTPLVVYLQASPVAGSTWGGGTASYAALTASGTFLRA